MTGSLNIAMYSTLIDRVIRPRRLLEVPGDLLELGCMTGGGTELFSLYAATEAEGKKVWAVDAFDFSLDATVNSRGDSMESIYRSFASSGSECHDAFLARTRHLGNVHLFVGDTRGISLPDGPLCFAFVDCGHSPECILSDFELVWRRLSPGGIIAFHDFGGDLPQVTSAICDAVQFRADEIAALETIPEHWMIWIEKRAGSVPARASHVIEAIDRLRNRFRLVVASYREDLVWTERVAGPVTIYDASGTNRRPGVITVENRARETGQYLGHIVANYPRFHEWEVFVQGNPFDHTNDPLLHGGGFDGSWAPFQPLGGTRWFNQHHCEHDRWAADFARDWLGAVPEGLPWVVGAQFGVNRKLLLNRSLDYWQRLHRKVLDEDATSPWAMERLWSAIF